MTSTFQQVNKNGNSDSKKEITKFSNQISMCVKKYENEVTKVPQPWFEIPICFHKHGNQLYVGNDWISLLSGKQTPEGNNRKSYKIHPFEYKEIQINPSSLESYQ